MKLIAPVVISCAVMLFGTSSFAFAKQADISSLVADVRSLSQRTADFTPEEWNFILGYVAYRQSQCGEVLKHFSSPKSIGTLLADHALFYRADCELRLGKAAQALSAAERLQRDYPDSVWSDDARLVQAKALLDLRRPEQARVLLTRAVSGVKDPNDAFDLHLLLARSHIDSKNFPAADALLRRLALGAASHAQYEDLVPLVKLYDDRAGAGLLNWMNAPQQRLSIARSFEMHSHWDDAIAWLEPLSTRKDLSDDFLAQVKWLLGMSLARVHQYTRAVKLLEEVRSMPQSAPFRGALLSRLAMTYTKLGDYDRAEAVRRSMLPEKRADEGARKRLQMQLAFLKFDRGDIAGAAEAFSQLSRTTQGATKESAQWYNAWCQYRLGKFSEAAQQFEKLLSQKKGAGKLTDRARYWKARSLEASGKKEEARALLRTLIGTSPVGYYQELALRRIEGDNRCTENFCTNGRQPFPAAAEWKPSASQIQDAATKFVHIRRALAFNHLGLPEEVVRELSTASSSVDAESRPILMWLAKKNHGYHRAMNAAISHYASYFKSVPSDSFSRFVWQSGYPFAYADVIRDATKGSVVDPLMIAALMRTESNFRPRVVSPAGAIGLMQLMPTTAVQYWSGSEKFDSRSLYQPAVNIELGVRYVQKLADQFPQHPIAWIAAYNAGEEAVSRWLSQTSTQDIEEFIEEIPYKETNLYVKKVLSAWWIHQRLYPSQMKGAMPSPQTPHHRKRK